MVGDFRARVQARCGCGAHVDSGVSQLRNVVQQPVLGFVRDLVGSDKLEVVGYDDSCVSDDAVPDPAEPDVLDAEDTWHARHSRGWLVR